MSKYTHITEMEMIMNRHEILMDRLSQLLEDIEKEYGDYQSLIQYYYSDQRVQDLEDDHHGLIPDGLCRGVLSEDSIYNLMTDYHQSVIKMLNLSTKILKN